MKLCTTTFWPGSPHPPVDEALQAVLERDGHGEAAVARAALRAHARDRRRGVEPEPAAQERAAARRDAQGHDRA